MLEDELEGYNEGGGGGVSVPDSMFQTPSLSHNVGLK